MTDLKTESKKLREWAIEKALPFWAQNAIDAQGGFYEDLTLSGVPNINAIRRVRVQARQVYVYAIATELGWYDGKKTAEQTFDFMCEKGLSPDGKDGFVHLIHPDYSIKSDRRDFYDHAFYLLSCAWMYRVFKTPKALDVADQIRDMMDTKMTSEFGGWTECVPDGDQAMHPRRQNPHMHFLEASMALYDATQNPLYLEDAKTVFELFKAQFFDSESVFIREFFEDNWKRLDGERGDSAEPGHAAEWVWLLWEFEKRTGISTQDYASALYKTCVRPEIFLNDEENFDRTPKRQTKRLWVQTELIKAHLAQAERGVTDAREGAARAIKKFRTLYLNPDLTPEGTWIDQIDVDGTPCAKTIPTSTFYHIICMIAEAVRVSDLN